MGRVPRFQPFPGIRYDLHARRPGRRHRPAVRRDRRRGAGRARRPRARTTPCGSTSRSRRAARTATTVARGCSPSGRPTACSSGPTTTGVHRLPDGLHRRRRRHRHTTGVIGALELARPGPTSSPTSTPRRRPGATGSTSSGPAGQPLRRLGAVAGRGADRPAPGDAEPVADVDDGEGVRHTLWLVDDPDGGEAIAERWRRSRSSSPTATIATRPRWPTGTNASGRGPAGAAAATLA